MSDLDADLYGGEQPLGRLLDLYGNDEAEFSNEQAANDDKDTQAPTESPTADPQPAAAAAKEHQAAAKSTPAGSTETNSTQYSASATTTSAIPTYTQPQQIQTYEPPQPSDYRDSVPSGREGGYQNIPVNERTVRPSEMKDEG
ncbi:hypothetical protein H0H81_004592 [Sphagnurus paluster]|uniref:Uncharacterized protein n=1 Tax=Sphagnurus paluster TaxID=117069 RepID=A0A9P7FSQ5_9AGAR|nr:hypothetical protein H0H81_004592 [Sphagnurus paluster]